MATSLYPEIDRKTTVPFHLKIFYKTGTFHRLDEFQSTSSPLPPHIQISTWLNCTLRELSHHIASNVPDLLPSPPIGTRLVFRLVFPDTKLSHAHSQGPGRFTTKDLGSVVIGSSSQTPEPSRAFKSENINPNYNNRDDDDDGMGEYGNEIEKRRDSGHWGFLTDAQTEIVKGGLLSDDLGGTPQKSLQDVRFVIGDYIDCAILPPLSSGDIAASPEHTLNPAPQNTSGPGPVYSLSGAGRGNARGRSGGGANEFIHPSRAGRFGIGSGASGGGSWRNGQGDFGGGRGGVLGGPRENGFGGFRVNNGVGGGGGFRGGGRGGTNASYGMGREEVPVGEWRRGEKLPDTGNRGGRDYGYKGGRGGGRW